MLCSNNKNHFEEKLNLSNVDLLALEKENLVELTKLEVLNASHNKLIIIPANLFENNKQLILVDFTFNQISEIDPLAFDGAATMDFSPIMDN